MAFCLNCGHQLADGAKFCYECGAQVGVQNANNDSRKTVYDGNLHKCPKCGEQLNAFVASCPVCGYELRGTQETSCVHELSLKLEKAETDKQKMEIISNFYIPNTKEDIYEFFILAYSNIIAGGYALEAWAVKLEQAHLKAKIAFDGGPEFKYINELYTQIKKASIKTNLIKSKWFKAALTFSVGLLLVLCGFLIPSAFSIENNNISGPLYFIGMIGIVPFFAGLIMFILPERKRHKRT